MAQQPLVGYGVIIIETSRKHPDPPHSVGLLWKNDEPDLETLPGTAKYSQETDVHASGGILPTIPVSERLQNHTLDCSVTGIGTSTHDVAINYLPQMQGRSSRCTRG
jgi:hypothetical protein